jgi:hypothetical protein
MFANSARGLFTSFSNYAQSPRERVKFFFISDLFSLELDFGQVLNLRDSVGLRSG